MDVRKLVFHNVACGVPLEKVAPALGITDEQAKDAFDEVALKLAGHQVFESMVYAACQTPADARTNRVRLLLMLEKLDLDAGLVARVARVQSHTTRQE